MRAIAVLAVVVYHLQAAWLPGGFSGVDIFFVISGFVVSASVGGRERSGLPAFAAFFLARRIRRIVPALLVCLFLTSLLSTLLIPSAWLSQANQETGHYAFFGLGNLVLNRTSNDYFSPITAFNPYAHTWSLGIEEQFYLLFPTLFLGWNHGRPWRRLSAVLFAVALLGSAVYSAMLGTSDATRAFYMLGSRFWELAAGVLLYQVMVLAGRRFDGEKQDTPRWFAWGAGLSLLAIAANFAMARPERFPFPGAILSVLGTLGMLFFLHGGRATQPLVRVLASAPARYVGRISYSLYLWHWPVFVLFRWTVGIDGVVAQLAALALAGALAVASYHLVEVPLRRTDPVRRLSLPHWRVVLTGFACIVAVAAVSRGIEKMAPLLSFSSVTRHADDWYPKSLKHDPAFPGCTVRSKSSPVGAGFALTITRQGCTAPATAPHIFVVGDSHAMAFLKMLSLEVLSSGSEVTLYNNSGCPFMSLQPWREDSSACQASAKMVMDSLLGRIRSGDIVFLPSLRLPRFVDEWVRYPDAAMEDQIFGKRAVRGRTAAAADARSVLQSLQSRGARVLIEAPLMVLKQPPFRCAESYNRGNAICEGSPNQPRKEVQRLRAPALQVLQSLAAEVPHVSIWDPLPVLCPPDHGECGAYEGGRPLFFDGDHLSGYANRLLWPSFAQAVTAAN